ncbi:MAG: hypothetical protein OXC40_00295 [Proteobacteria bacterium]|nr:hypothetical protein [Pseudomonadota bacterium]
MPPKQNSSHDITGHHHHEIRQQMTLLLDKKMMPQVLLFYGRSGIGKKKLLRLVTQLAVCECSPRGCSPSSSSHNTMCQGCHLLQSEIHHDVCWPLILKQDEHYKKEHSELIHDHLSSYPSRSDYRIIMLPDVDRFYPRGINQLLKTLEEPPPHALILMSSSRIDALLPTLKSRAMKYLVRPLTKDQFTQVMKQKSRHQPTDKLMSELYRISSGSVGEALYILEHQNMFRDLTELIQSREPIWSLSKRVATFLEQHPLTTAKLLYGMELTLHRIYQKHLTGSAGQINKEIMATRRKLLSKYHRGIKDGHPSLNNHLLIQAWISLNYLSAE